MNDGTLDLIKAMRTLLTPPGAWCQGATARRADGTSTTAVDPEAVSFCLLGAIDRADGWGDGDAAEALIRARVQQYGTNLVGFWNDQMWRTQNDVLALLDTIIAENEVPA